MHTEFEAREKWCPFAQTDTEYGGSYNRDFKGQLSKLCLCIASDCMAWRWTEFDIAHSDKKRGYCGLAGKQE